MWLLQLFAWIATELFMTRVAAESKPEMLSIIHGDKEQSKQSQMAGGRQPKADGE